MKRAILALVAALAVVPAHAATYTSTGSYRAGGIPGTQTNLSATAEDTTVNVGGYEFAASAKLPVSVRVVDASGTSVGVTACSDVNGDGSCGSGEPTATGCSASALSIASFPSGEPILVYVTTLDTTLDCNGVSAGGTITVTYRDR